MIAFEIISARLLSVAKTITAPRNGCADAPMHDFFYAPRVKQLDNGDVDVWVADDRVLTTEMSRAMLDECKALVREQLTAAGIDFGFVINPNRSKSGRKTTTFLTGFHNMGAFSTSGRRFIVRMK